MEGQQEIDRADLEGMLKELVPDWSPGHLQEEIEFMPVLQLQEVKIKSLIVGERVYQRKSSHYVLTWQEITCRGCQRTRAHSSL